MCSQADDPTQHNVADGIQAFENEYMDAMTKAQINVMREMGWSISWVNDTVTAVKLSSGTTYRLSSTAGWDDAIAKMIVIVKHWEGR